MATAVLGMGKTGLSLARYLQSTGEKVWGIDDNPQLRQTSPGAERFCERLFLQGEIPDFSQIRSIFISPGISPEHPAARAARHAGLKLEGELDLAFSLCRGKVLAVTGTNGKSTTVTLLGQMLEQAGETVAVGGNLGTPFIDLVTDPRNFSSYVVEVSSYQLETTERFRPKVAALLNITDDHLDRYSGLAAYAQAKGKIFAFQDSEDFAIYNEDDIHVLEVLEGVRSPKRVGFSISKKVRGAYAETSEEILWAPEGQIASRFDMKQSRLTGLHNLENACCAIACAKAYGLADAAIQRALNAFQGLPHRIEWVAKIRDVAYFDDSKATNVGATVMSLASFEKDVVLILGGRDKGGDYAPLRPLVKHKVRALILMGEAKEKIREALRGSAEMIEVKSMEEAVREAYRVAPAGGTVLLSPACSSFDMFRDYHDRGEQFKAWVKKLS